MSEEQQVALEFCEIDPPEFKALMCKPQIGKFLKASVLECLLLQLCLYKCFTVYGTHFSPVIHKIFNHAREIGSVLLFLLVFIVIIQLEIECNHTNFYIA